MLFSRDLEKQNHIGYSLEEIFILSLLEEDVIDQSFTLLFNPGLKQAERASCLTM